MQILLVEDNETIIQGLRFFFEKNGYELVVKTRIRQAVEYMDWFQPAWDQLTEDDQFVLDCFYRDENTYGSYAADTVASHFGIENASAHRKKRRALDRMTLLLFGKP